MSKRKISKIVYTYVSSEDYTTLCEYWFYMSNQELHFTVGDEQTRTECQRIKPEQIIKTRTATKSEWLIIL